MNYASCPWSLALQIEGEGEGEEEEEERGARERDRGGYVDRHFSGFIHVLNEYIDGGPLLHNLIIGTLAANDNCKHLWSVSGHNLQFFLGFVILSTSN
jgi:hypothetical protein